MITFNNDLSFDYVNNRYRYDPITGHIISKHFNRPVGVDRGSGYVSITIDKRPYMAHRLAWLLTHGEWPEDEIDHINGDRSDNRLVNLRPATRQQNMINRRMHKSNKLGVKGVSQLKNRYRAQLWHNGGFVLNQMFSTVEEASAAYQAKAAEVFGEWACPR